jgi:hypothetical protein
MDCKTQDLMLTGLYCEWGPTIALGMQRPVNKITSYLRLSQPAFLKEMWIVKTRDGEKQKPCVLASLNHLYCTRFWNPAEPTLPIYPAQQSRVYLTGSSFYSLKVILFSFWMCFLRSWFFLMSPFNLKRLSLLNHIYPSLILGLYRLWVQETSHSAFLGLLILFSRH